MHQAQGWALQEGKTAVKVMSPKAWVLPITMQSPELKALRQTWQSKFPLRLEVCVTNLNLA